MSPLQKKVQKIIVIALIVLVLGGGLFYGGYAAGVQRAARTTASLIVNGGAPAELKDANVSVLWDTIALLKQKYYDIKNISDQELIYGAAAGATQAVGDPYTVFFSPQDAQSFSDNLNGDFGGIGAEIGVQKGQLVVIAPLKGTPADTAGLKSGDAIMAVNGSSTVGMTADEAVNLIRGEIGTSVTLSILRSGWSVPKDFKITRANITVPTLDWKMMPGHIAYFDIYTFNANAANLFYNDALAALMQGAKGIVLDLRDDPGGYLDVAQQIAGWFLPRGSVVVRERMRDGSETVLRANGNQALANLPVVVLVNGGSASASEILSGALRDNRGAKLVGTQTFGKGSVQELENLPDGSELKVSIAEWLTPKGYTINHVGLKPDYIVQYTEADAAAGKDPQLAKAVQVLQSEMQ